MAALNHSLCAGWTGQWWPPPLQPSRVSPSTRRPPCTADRLRQGPTERAVTRPVVVLVATYSDTATAAIAPHHVLGVLDDHRAMELRVGNKYRLGRKIGSGSFGDIYLGKSCALPSWWGFMAVPVRCTYFVRSTNGPTYRSLFGSLLPAARGTDNSECDNYRVYLLPFVNTLCSWYRDTFYPVTIVFGWPM